MSGNTGDMKKTTPVLTGASNYLEWKSAMKSLLQVMGVWHYVHTQVAAVVAGQGGATAKQQATYETNWDKALGTIMYYTSTLIRQNLMNENDPHVAWEQLNTSYGTPGAAGVFVEFKCLTWMMQSKLLKSSSSKETLTMNPMLGPSLIFLRQVGPCSLHPNLLQSQHYVLCIMTWQDKEGMMRNMHID